MKKKIKQLGEEKWREGWKKNHTEGKQNERKAREKSLEIKKKRPNLRGEKTTEKNISGEREIRKDSEWKKTKEHKIRGDINKKRLKLSEKTLQKIR